MTASSPALRDTFGERLYSAAEQLLSGGKLPSRRQHRTDPDKSALQTIMGEVDHLSRGHG